MNRRGFISLLAGAAGAAVIPWRGLDEPTVFLPPAGGWAARSVVDLWLDYANQIRPAGTFATAVVDDKLDTPWVVDEVLSRGEVRLTVAANISPSMTRQMRQALLREPDTAYWYTTLGDFAPWDFDPDRRYSCIVEKSDDIRRIDSLSRLI